MDNETILVHTADVTVTRGPGPRELKVEILAQNINLFLSGIEGILEKAPAEVGNFHFVEFTVSAEISANGKLVLMGSGLEAAAKGGLAFKFVRKSS